MTDDYANDPEFKAWAQDVRAHLLPKLSESALTVSLVPEGNTDVKFAVELGFSIMMDKPIIAVVQPGAKVPDHLVRVADAIVEIDMRNPGPEASEKLQRAIEAAMAEIDQEA